MRDFQNIWFAKMQRQKNVLKIAEECSFSKSLVLFFVLKIVQKGLSIIFLVLVMKTGNCCKKYNNLRNKIEQSNIGVYIVKNTTILSTKSIEIFYTI